MGGPSFSICSIVILFIFVLNFFSKKSIKTEETDTYRNLLILTLIGTSLDVTSYVLYKTGIPTDSPLYILSGKVVFIYFIAWIIWFLRYVYSISETSLFKINPKILYGFIIAIAVAILFAPLNYEITQNSLYPTGLSVGITYLTVAVCLLFMVVLLLENFKVLKNKKYIPVFLIVLMVIVATVIQKLFPDVFLINFALTIVVVTMYFTIENPDMKMIETLLRNKELVEQAVNDKSNFLFKVSQEIKKPVNNIIDSIKIYNSSTSEEEKKDIIESISQDANNVHFIVNDITDLSSTDFKKLKIQDTSYITKKMIVDIKTNALNKLKVSGKEDQVTMKLEALNTYPEKLSGDYMRIKQILLSIISNSIKYTEKGFIDVELDIITRYDICRMIFTIKDSGKGMDISEINKLLSSNEELDLSEFDKMDSLELPLPVVIKMIKALGGSISIRSGKDSGTIFVVVIDQKIVSSDEDIAIKSAKKYNENIKANNRVLIADDSETLDKLGRLFAMYDYDTMLTISGHDVIDKIKSGETYDLIVLKDEMKPDSGYDILKQLKEIPKFNIPVYITIKKDKEFIKDHFIKDGFKDVLLESKIEDEVKRICE